MLGGFPISRNIVSLGLVAQALPIQDVKIDVIVDIKKT
jgi:hypothetical protein